MSLKKNPIYFLTVKMDLRVKQCPWILFYFQSEFHPWVKKISLKINFIPNWVLFLNWKFRWMLIYFQILWNPCVKKIRWISIYFMIACYIPERTISLNTTLFLLFRWHWKNIHVFTDNWQHYFICASSNRQKTKISAINRKYFIFITCKISEKRFEISAHL